MDDMSHFIKVDTGDWAHLEITKLRETVDQLLNHIKGLREDIHDLESEVDDLHNRIHELELK